MIRQTPKRRKAHLFSQIDLSRNSMIIYMTNKWVLPVGRFLGVARVFRSFRGLPFGFDYSQISLLRIVPQSVRP
jgi:hypothetical protein